MSKTCILCQCESAVLTLWLAIAMSDMAIEGEQYMDTDLEEEISISTESYMLLRHQDPSSSSEDCKEDEEKGSDSGMCQTRSKRNVHAVLPFTGPSPGVPVSNIVRNPPPPNCLSFFFPFRFSEINIYCHQYYAAKSYNSVPQEEMFYFLALVLKMSHDQRECIETVLV